MAKMWPSYWPYSIYIYIHTIESKVGPRSGVFESKLGPSLCQNLVQYFCFFPNFIVFFGHPKKQIVCRDAKIFFGSLSRCQKRIFEKCAFFVFVFFCWRKKKRKYYKHGKRKFQKKTREIVFLGGSCEQKNIFCRNGIF